MENQIFNECRSRLVKEGILKSVIAGVSVGLAVDFVAALVLWFTEFRFWWISLIAGVVVAAAAACLFYFKKYRPTQKQVAERIDRLGFDERFITMLEYEGDTSFIAIRQREEAIGTLEKANRGSRIGSRIRFTVSKVALCLLAVAVVGSVPMTTVAALAANDVIGSGTQIIGPIINPVTPSIYNVDFTLLLVDDETREVLEIIDSGSTGEFAYFDGEAQQKLQEGSSSEEVVANAYYSTPSSMEFNIPDAEGNMTVITFYTEEDEEPRYFMVLGWTYDSGNCWDLEKTPQMTEENVQSDKKPYAVVVEIFPPAPQLVGGGGGGGSGNGGNSDSSGEWSEGDPGGGSGSGIDASENDKVIDGETDYRSVYENYYNDAMQSLTEDGSLSEEERKIIETYFGILK